jgi:hypothetical protein
VTELEGDPMGAARERRRGARISGEAMCTHQCQLTSMVFLQTSGKSLYLLLIHESDINL